MSNRLHHLWGSNISILYGRNIRCWFLLTKIVQVIEVIYREVVTIKTTGSMRWFLLDTMPRMQQHIERDSSSSECWTVLCYIALHCAILYYAILYYAVMYCTILCYAVLHCAILHCTALYYVVMYCTALYCTVLYCTVLYCTVLLGWNSSTCHDLALDHW